MLEATWEVMQRQAWILVLLVLACLPWDGWAKR